MKKHFKTALLPGFLLAFSPFALAQTATIPGNVLINGDFETAPDGTATGWEGFNGTGISIGEEKGNRFLSLSNSDATKNVEAKQTVALQAGAAGQKWELTGRIRVKNIAPGEKDWHNARVQNTWLDDEFKPVKPWPLTPGYSAPTAGWVNFKVVLTVPAGATKFRVQPAIFYSVGAADYDDLVLRPQGTAQAIPNPDAPIAVG